MPRLSSRVQVALLIALTVSLAACGGTAAAGGSVRGSGEITADEIRASGAADAHQAVQGLRPAWLRRRGDSSLAGAQGTATAGDGLTTQTDASPVRVYVDGNLLGGVAELRNIPAADVASIRFLEPGPANVRFGPGHVNGAIVVTSRRGG